MKNKQEPRSLTEWPLSISSDPPSMTNRDGRQSVVSTAPSAQVFTKWLANKSRTHNQHGSSDGSGSSNNNNNNAQLLFPARLALALGMAKTLLGILLVAFGALALWEHAAMSYLGSGESV